MSHELGIGYFRFLANVYQPLLLAAPVMALLFVLDSRFCRAVTGRS